MGALRSFFGNNTGLHRVACLLICAQVSLVSQESSGAPGDLDTTFNGTGKVITSMVDLGDYGYGLAVQADGKILVTGSATIGSSSDFALARYNADGGLDTNFNATGIVTTPVGGAGDYGYGLAVQADDKILVAGWSIIGAYGDFALVRYDSADPHMAVEQPAGTDLTDGAASVAFDLLLTGATSGREFTIRNSASGSTLTGLGITFDGPDAADFTVTTGPTAPLSGPGGSTTFTVRFAPTTGGSKAAAMHIASNDGYRHPFDINLTGRALARDGDEDADGVTNEAEMNMASLGFDPFVDSTALRTLMHDNALGTGLYRASDMQTLALGSPVLEKDPGTGQFHLIIGIDRSPDLSAWSPLTGFSPTYDEASGLIDIGILPDGSNPQFFKVIRKKP